MMYLKKQFVGLFFFILILIHGVGWTQQSPGVIWDYTTGFGIDWDGKLKKSAAKAWGNAGFFSKNRIPNSGGGSFQIVLNSELYFGKVFGFTDDYSTLNYPQVKFAFYINRNNVSVLVNGSVILLMPAHPGMALEMIKTSDGAVEFKVNGGGVYKTNPGTSTTDLYLAGGSYAAGSTIESMLVDFYNVSTVPQQIYWNQLPGMCLSGINWTKCTPGVSSDAGFLSRNMLWSEQHASIGFNIHDPAKEKAVGLATHNDNLIVSDLEYAFHLIGGNLTVKESGVQKASLGAPSVGDRLKIAKDQGQWIKYYVNDALVYYTSKKADENLYLSGLVLNNGDYVNALWVEFEDPAKHGYAVLDKRYTSGHHEASGILFFRFKEDFHIDSGVGLDFTIYDEYRNEMYANCNLLVVDKKRGVNMFAIDFTSTCTGESDKLIDDNVYFLEAVDSKGKMQKVKFRYSEPDFD